MRSHELPHSGFCAVALLLALPGIALAQQARTPLAGVVDLHTHPLANLGFAGKLLYGGIDAAPAPPGGGDASPAFPYPAGGGAMLPADPYCNQTRLYANPPIVIRAQQEIQALGHDGTTHGANSPGDPCYDAIRGPLISFLQSMLGAANPSSDAFGYPTFVDWPVWNDITHQHMWVEWIRRAFYYGGLRVMVALAVNNKSLADMVAGPGDGPDDDMRSADLQIRETKAFVSRHSDFMQVAYGSADVDQIVRSGKLAVILGVEIDHIGNFGTPLAGVPPEIGARDEIDRLYGEGVRYIFPVHLLDNPFGGTAAYQLLFDLSTIRESGHPWNVVCADPQDQINMQLQSLASLPGGILGNLLQLAWQTKMGGSIPTAPAPPACPPGIGHKNALGLTPLGAAAINEMMRLGMLIDIDHMSQASENAALALAEQVPGGYPLNSGHSGLRDPSCLPQSKGSSCITNERSSTGLQYARIGRLHGMAGVGSAKSDSWVWLTKYNLVLQAMGPGAVAGFGTDANGLEFGMPPRPPAVRDDPVLDCIAANPCNAQEPLKQIGCPVGPPVPATYFGCCRTNVPIYCNKLNPGGGTTCISGSYCQLPASAVSYWFSFQQPTDPSGKTWNYNTDGVAHYGMLADFLVDVATLPVPPGGTLSGQQVVANLNQGAEYFYQTWRKAEALSTAVFTSWQPSAWLGWQQVGVSPTSPPPTAVKQVAVSRNADGRLEVVYIAPTNNTLLHTWQTTPEVAWWPSMVPEPLGGSPANKLAMARNADGRLQIFYTGPGNVILTNSQVTPGGAWSGEQPLGQGAGLQIAVGQNADGRLEVFVVGTDNRLYHNAQLQPSGSAWSGWSPLNSSPASQLGVASNADGRLEVFYNGPNNTIYTNTQVSAGGNWTGETSMGGGALQFSVQQNKVGGLEVFIVGTDNAGWRNVQTGPNGPWGGWATFGGWLSQLATGRNSDGRLEVFCMGVKNALYHNVQTAPASASAPDGAWSGWQPLGGAAQQLVTGVNADGRLDVFVVGTDNLLYHNLQSP
jgi:hypothetical protein